ncbi:SDR family NAD(P)-dependent oxidoreductase [Novispirillum itersonii]|uniref:SDR family NAD(P)-dependent oxidoreductase n=1 Tax=Novispirillum itersonii TaxID=189 RepID=UPI00039EA057|nr:SDR family oxidoreductase [Novispirillum itersonii]
MPPVSSPTLTPDGPRRSLFITGGAGGLGAGLVRAAARAGHNVAFTYRTSASAADALAADLAAVPGAGRCLPLRMDQRDTDSVEQAISAALTELDIDAVILNAGAAKTGLLAQMEDADWLEVVDTNLTGAFRVCRRFLWHFLGRRSGQFIHIGSVAAGGMAGHAAYAASKAGVEGLSASLAREYGPRGITSNVVSLGLFDGGMGSEQASDSLRQFWLTHCPQRRTGHGDDIASTVLFLCSGAATFVNGQVIRLTGGLDWAP